MRIITRILFAVVVTSANGRDIFQRLFGSGCKVKAIAIVIVIATDVAALI